MFGPASAAASGGFVVRESGSSETLLIVDDDVRVVELLQITLGGRGYQVLTAYDGETALDSVRSRKPDLVVLDIRLPKKSGFEILRSIREDSQLADIPVILISANAATESRLQGFKLGADDYLTKPFSPRELILRIRRVLHRSRDRELLRMRNEVLESELRRGRETLLQMQEEMSERVAKIGSLMSRVLEMNQAPTLEEVLERFVVSTVDGFEFRRVALLTEGIDGSHEARVWRGVPETAVRDLRLRKDAPLLRMVQNIARPVRIEELEDYPEVHSELGRLSAAGLTLLVPAYTGTQLRGILGLGDRASSQPIGRYDTRMLQILGNSIATALRNASENSETQRTFLETTSHLIRNIEDLYPQMRGHSLRVTEIALEMGRRLGQTEVELETLRFGALLHDLGELDRYSELMESGRILSDEERRRLRQESAARGEVLLGGQRLGRVGDILRHHQEHWDGSGFPDRLRGLEIPLPARIVAIANAWDALVHDRPHRPAFSTDEAKQIIESRAGEQFDPDLVPVLFEVVSAMETAEPTC